MTLMSLSVDVMVKQTELYSKIVLYFYHLSKLKHSQKDVLEQKTFM